MTNQASNTSTEKEMHSFTASFLLSEFRKDIRSLHDHFRNDIRDLHSDINAVNGRIDVTNQRLDSAISKIDNRFLWTLGTMLGIAFAIIGVVITH